MRWLSVVDCLPDGMTIYLSGYLLDQRELGEVGNCW